jgi:hypothetical protein
MLYAIISEDASNSLELRKANRPAHLERLEILKKQGRLKIAGPHPSVDSEDPGQNGYSGSLVVAEFDTLADAEAWASLDPYQTAGVYKHVIVKPFKYVLP